MEEKSLWYFFLDIWLDIQLEVFNANEMCCACGGGTGYIKNFLVLNNVRSFRPYFSTMLSCLTALSLFVT